MAAPADAAATAAWQPPRPGPGELERAFAPLGPAGQAVLRALDAYAIYMADGDSYDLSPFEREHGGQMEDAVHKHTRLEHQSDNPVPYRWQVGRFLRHAIDTHNVVGVKKVMRLVYGSTNNQHLVLSLIQHSLHPDKAEAVKLFQDIANALTSEQDIRWWGAFVSELVDTAQWQTWGERVTTHGGAASRHVLWTDRVELNEYLAKVEKALAIGSPFPLHFNTIGDHATLEPGDIPLPVFRICVNAFIQHDGIEAQMQTSRRLLDAAILHAARGVDVDACNTLVRHLRHFIELRRPALIEPYPQRLTPTGAQADAIQLLANHLARSQIGDARVLPSIMDFVRYIPPRRGGDDAQRAANQTAYRQHEFQVAHTAVGRAHIARAAAHVSAAPAAASAPVPSRAREEEAEKGGDQAAKRRA